MKRRILTLGLLAAPATLRAQGTWPTRPVRIVVPYAPGGGTDVTNRAYAEALGQRFGSAFVVENRAGGNGIVGTDAVVRAAPDGHTLVAPNITHSMLRHITPNLPFDPIADVTPVALLASYCFVLTAFVVVVLGGMRSMYGAFFGAMIIGVVDSLSGYYVAPDLKEVVYFAIFLLILIFKPTGLFGSGRGTE